MTQLQNERRNEVIQTKSAATVKVPSSWQITQGNSDVQFDGPEHDISIYLQEVNTQDLSIPELAKLGWEHWKPGFNLNVLMELPLPQSGNWEKGTMLIYDVPTSEGRTIVASVRLLQGRAYLALIDGTTAAFSRRGSEIQSIYESWIPSNYVETNLNLRPVKQWTESDTQDFKNFISDSMRQLKVPGLAVAIVSSDGQTLFSQGFGVKQLGTSAAVTTDTPFMIGSMTKSQTTLMIAKLVEMGIFTWDTSITHILPDFRIADPDLTRVMTMRHTVSASTGMPCRSLDFIFKYQGVTPETRLQQMREMKPTSQLGEIFQYSNFLFMAGGYASAKAYALFLGLPQLNLEEAYEKAMKDLVFNPLQMSKTVIKIEDAKRLGAAMPHALDFVGNVAPISPDIEEAIYSVAPAGAIWSTVNDFSKYLLLELNQGSLDGHVLFKESPLLERRTPGIKMGEKSFYGLGLVVSEEQGMSLITHSGGTLGFGSDFFFLPDKGLGLVVLNNSSGLSAHSLNSAIRKKFMEITFGAQSQSNSQVQAALSGMDSMTLHNRRHIFTDIEHTRQLETLLGNYDNPHLGKAQLRKTKESFELDFGEWKSEIGISIEPDGKKNIVFTQAPLSGLKFLVLENGQNGSRLLLDGGQDKYEFVRIR